VFVPLTLAFLLRDMPRNQAQNRGAFFGMNTFARLRPDIALEQASARINALHSQIIAERETGGARPLPPRTIELQPGAQGQRPEIAATVGQPLSLLLCLSAVGLLGVCSNVDNL
jgi:hypothetical protein